MRKRLPTGGQHTQTWTNWEAKAFVALGIDLYITVASNQHNNTHQYNLEHNAKKFKSGESNHIDIRLSISSLYPHIYFTSSIIGFIAFFLLILDAWVQHPYSLETTVMERLCKVPFHLGNFPGHEYSFRTPQTKKKTIHNANKLSILHLYTLLWSTPVLFILLKVRSANTWDRGTELFRKEVLELCARKNRGLAVKDVAMSIKNSDFWQHDFLSQGFQNFFVSIYTHVFQSTKSLRRKPRNIKKKEKEKEKKQVYLWLTNLALHLQNRPACKRKTEVGRRSS